MDLECGVKIISSSVSQSRLSVRCVYKLYSDIDLCRKLFKLKPPYFNVSNDVEIECCLKTFKSYVSYNIEYVMKLCIYSMLQMLLCPTMSK